MEKELPAVLRNDITEAPTGNDLFDFALHGKARIKTSTGYHIYGKLCSGLALLRSFPHLDAPEYIGLYSARFHQPARRDF